jgi:hypothetical protein
MLLISLFEDCNVVLGTEIKNSILAMYLIRASDIFKQIRSQLTTLTHLKHTPNVLGIYIAYLQHVLSTSLKLRFNSS